MLATAVIADLVGLGMSVPADISVCGFDGMRFGVLTPPLTTVAQPSDGIGQAACSNLLAQIHGQPAQSNRLPHCIVVGGTAAAVRAERARRPHTHGFFMLIAQITDLHMRTPGDKAYGIIDPPRSSARPCALNALSPRPDCVLITGDLTDLGRPHEYAQLRAQLQALEMPYFLLPGNHDDRAGLRAAFPTTPTCKARVRSSSIRSTPIRCLLALDTVVPMKSHGELCGERLAWLEQQLAQQPGRPTLVLMHHPPFLTGIEHMDAIGLFGAPELERIVSRHPNVERVLCGHLHRTIFQRFGGTIASTCPGTAHQLALELGPRPTAIHHGTAGLPTALVERRPAGHAPRGDGEYPGPYPFA